MKIQTGDRSYEVHEDLKPVPRRVQWWRRTRNQRQRALKTFNAMASRALILAISAAGAILISYGVYTVHPSAGFVTGGVMCWLLLWSHEKDRGGRK